jgi:NADH-quinone oxidoreductase subunit I
LVKQLIDAIKNLAIGMMTTSKHMGRHAITLQYPKEKWPMPERSRGIVVLLSDKETGDLNCTVCMLCARACPTAAIQIKYEKDEKKKRQLKDFVVDYNLCCFCGLCEDACNFSAIKMAPKYEFSTLDKNDLVWHTEKLQEMGRDVPYVKPERKKPAAKPAAPKPAPKPVTPKTEDKPAVETEKKVEPKADEKPAAKPEEKTEEKKPEGKPVVKPKPESTDEKPADESKSNGEEEKE